MNRLFSAFALVFLIFIFFPGCNRNQNDYIPEVQVNFIIDLYLPTYNDLNFVTGSYTDSTRGFKGIIIYRATESDFYAYDQACPYDPFEEKALVEVMPWESIAEDKYCGSKFLLLDGYPIEGPAELPLKAYNTHFDGRYLRIYN